MYVMKKDKVWATMIIIIKWKLFLGAPAIDW